MREAAVVDRLREDRPHRLVMVGLECQEADDDQHGEDVPPHRDVVQQGDQPDAEDVHQRVQPEDAGVHVDDLVRRGVERSRPKQVQQCVGEDRGAVVDAGGDRDLADQVEPASEPAPGRPSHLRSPVVQTARGRILRRDLGHPEPDDDHEDRDDRPAPRLLDRSPVVDARRVERERPRQDRDDRERDREVREAAHPSPQLLGVAEGVEHAPVLLVRRIIGHSSAS